MATPRGEKSRSNIISTPEKSNFYHNPMGVIPQKVPSDVDQISLKCAKDDTMFKIKVKHNSK
jgi:hypothetical protein